MTERGEELIAALLKASDGEQSGAIAFDLLQQVFRGYDAANLLPLLRSENGPAVEAGAWIFSEMGADASPFLSEVGGLLTSPHRKARFWAIDIVVATGATGPNVAVAISLLADDDGAVQWQALQGLSKMSSTQIASALPFLDAESRGLVVWLLEAGDMSETKTLEIIQGLDSSDRATRMFAAAAAVRCASFDERPLSVAAGSGDETIRSVAKLAMKVQRIGKE